MPAVAFGFGLFCDIVALVDLVLNIARALSDSRGSSSEWQTLRDNVQCVALTVMAIRGIPVVRGPQISDNLVEGRI